MTAAESVFGLDVNQNLSQPPKYIQLTLQEAPELVKVNHLLPAFLLSRRDRLCALKRGAISVLLTCLMAYIESPASRQRRVGLDQPDCDTFERAVAVYPFKDGDTADA